MSAADEEFQPKPEHCGCQFRHWWCAERLARWKAREQSRDRLRGQLVLDFWQRPTSPAKGSVMDVLGYWPPPRQSTPRPRWDGGVRRLHEPRSRNMVGHLRRTIRGPR